MYLKYYLEQLDYENMPSELAKYLNTPSLQRLKKIGYFCGMDFASKNIYNFKEIITRYDHSLTVALMVYKLTKDRNMALAGLYHDIATPCFSHVIDYMNKDYAKQEATEELTEKVIRSDSKLIGLLQKDGINPNEIIDFKRYPVVDNERPKVCADRLDGVILTGIGWTKNVTKCDINSIVTDMHVSTNEFGEPEIDFLRKPVVEKIIQVSESIDKLCHSNEDNYMMELLATITKYAIDRGIIYYEDLFKLNEEDLFSILLQTGDPVIEDLMRTFRTIEKENIPQISLPNVKVRSIKPLLNGKRVA